MRGNSKRGAEGDRNRQGTAPPIVIGTTHCGAPVENVTPGCPEARTTAHTLGECPSGTARAG